MSSFRDKNKKRKVPAQKTAAGLPENRTHTHALRSGARTHKHSYTRSYAQNLFSFRIQRPNDWLNRRQC